MSSTIQKSRAYKVFGMRVVDLVNSLFPAGGLPTGQQPKNGKIVRSEFFILWSMIASPDDATEFLDAILSQLLNFLESKTTPTHGVSLDTLVNTIAFILIFLPFKTNSTLVKSFLEKWATKTSDPMRDISRDHPAVRTVVRLLSLRVGGNEKESVEDILGPLIIGASTLFNSADFARLNSGIRWPTIDENEVRSSEFGFVYSYLMQLVASQVRTDPTDSLSMTLESSYQKCVLSFLVSKTLTLSQQVKMNPFVAQCTLLALLHIMKQVISVNSIVSMDFLSRAIFTLQPFYLWPEPHGSIVLSTINILENELLSPGFNRRSLLINQSRSVDWVSTTASNGYRHTKPIFYLYDSDDQSILPSLSVLDTIPYDAEKTVKPVSAPYESIDGVPLPPIAIQAHIILNTINVEAVCDHSEEVAYFPLLNPSHLNELTANQIAHFYAKIREVDNISVNSIEPVDETRRTRTNTLLSICNDIEKTSKSNGNVASQSYFSQTTDPLYNPPSPVVEHIRIPVNIRTPALASNIGTTGSLSTGDAAARQGRGLTYPAPAMYDRLHELFQAYSIDSTINHAPRDIHIVIAGDDILLHHVSTAYYLLRKLNSELLASLTPHFYLAPLTRNQMAGYIARHDSWYMRHMYTPFRSNALLVPWIGVATEDISLQKPNNQDGSTPVPPTVFLRDCISQYVRESECTLDSIIYQVEAYEDERAAISQQVSETIPFLQRVEVGQVVQAEEMCSRNPKLRPDDVLRDKAFAPNPLDLSVKFTLLDLSGTRQPETSEDPALYTSILLSSVPRKSDPCFPADPATSALELHAVATKTERSKLKKNLLISEPKQHVADMTISAGSGTKFKILVDGTLFGPFYQIKISPASLPGESVAKFPIHTFFPINP